MKEKILVVTALVETSPQAIPLGAACIVSAINNSNLHNQYEAELFSFSLQDIQQSSEKEQLAALGQALLAKNPSFVCFSVFVWNYDFLARIATQIKKERPSITLIAGGPEITAQLYLKEKHHSLFEVFDYAIAGSGEGAIVSLLENLPNQVKKTFYTSPYDVEKLPSPYLDKSLDPKLYSGALWELARGCPFKCSYCYESKSEEKVVFFPLERIKKELDFFVEKKVPQIFVLDPTYNGNKERALEILQLIKRKAPNIFFHFEVRAEFLDKKIAKLFSEISCSLQIGLQSAHEHILKNVHRSFNKKEFSQKVSLLNQTGAVFGFDLIYGLPGDTYENFKESIDYALSLYPNHLELFKLSVLPGTRLYDDAPQFNLEFLAHPPYHIVQSPTFSQKDLQKAQELAASTALFYTKGRSVSWFASMLHPLRMKASKFFEDFVFFLKKENATYLNQQKQYCIDFREVQKLQIQFVTEKYKAKHLDYLLPAVTDIINLQAALTSAYGEGRETVVNLTYYPEDLLSEYATDLPFFVKNAQKKRKSYKVDKQGRIRS
ncbi:MAG: radical SAM protein [Spirochaetaceae bacterium]|nr:radical SAM protein [Spirochaetaceae bacterium]